MRRAISIEKRVLIQLNHPQKNDSHLSRRLNTILMLNIFLPKIEPQESSSFENDCEETAACVCEKEWQIKSRE